MAVQQLLFATLLALAYAVYPFGNVIGKQDSLALGSSNRFLSCAAKYVDHSVLREMEHCASGLLPLKGLTNVRRNKRFGDHLVTISADNLINIYLCLAQSRNRVGQREFDRCFAKRPAQTLSAYHMCRSKIVGATDGVFYDIIAMKPELMQGVYECMRENTVAYTHPEAEQQISFENCARKVSANACGI